MTEASVADLVSRIDALLPQTQCTRCGFPTCRDYAGAIARGESDINHCPPGGEEGVVALAALLGRAPIALDPANGMEAPPCVAVIDEATCIGCTKCIQACPVDAIVGASKRMHTIIAAECTGCERCLPPCPVDCITLVEIKPSPLSRERLMARAGHARVRFEEREARLNRAREARCIRRVDDAFADDRASLNPLRPDRTAGVPSPYPLPQAGGGTAFRPSEAVDSANSGGGISRPNSEMSPATPPREPITRSAVLEAIARGKARRDALKDRRS